MLLHDLRYAVRGLIKAPGFAVAALLSLALGIGANTSIFTVLRAALLRPLPVSQPDQLVILSTERENGSPGRRFSYQHYSALRESKPGLQEVSGYSMLPLAVRRGAAAAEQVNSAAVSANYFQLLGVPLHAGRFFSEDEDRVGAGAQVVVLGYDYWRSRFNGSRDAIGASLTLNGKDFTVIGVASRDYGGLVRGEPEELWVPLAVSPLLSGIDLSNVRMSFLTVLARMRDGYSLEQAQAALSQGDGSLRSLGVLREDQRNVLESAQTGLMWHVTELRAPLYYLMAAVGMVLLIACANLTNLLLARSQQRRRELAVRMAIGGSRRNILRQLLTESVVLAAIAGVLGLVLAFGLTQVLVSYRPSTGRLLILDTAPDATILAFALGISMLTAVLVGIAPAVFGTRTDVLSVLKATTGRMTHARGRSVLVVVQVAMTLTLLTGATLLSRSVQKLGAIDLGYTTRNALIASINLAADGHKRDQGLAVLLELLDRIRGMPGVIEATAATTITPSLSGAYYTGVAFEGHEAAPGEEVGFNATMVDETYFAAMQLPLVLGREFTAADARGAPDVVIVNEEVARKYWPNENPIGKRIFLNEARTSSWEVVGVARSGKYRSMRETDMPAVWRPLRQSYDPWLRLLVHTNGEPLALTEAVRSTLQQLSPGVPLENAMRLQEHIDIATMRERMAARIAGGFSVLAMLLSAVGLYGLLSFMVTQRTAEIGVRMALGARRGQVLGSVLGRGLVVIGTGIIAGLLATRATVALLDSLVYGLPATDSVSLLIGATALAITGVLAALIPALRATSIEPMRALRSE